MVIIGIVGKPSSGKSTFLNAACLTDAKVSELPFTTIDANKGVAYVKVQCACSELKLKDNPKNSICINGIRFIPINMLDVAGLVPDAHKGKGLGNKFLNDLSRADVLLHIVDITGALDTSGNRVSMGENDPYDDVVFLEDELNYWVKDIIEREDWNKLTKITKDKKKMIIELHNRLSGLKISQQHIITALKKTSLDEKLPSLWTDDERFQFSKNIREISKPILIIANKIDKEISTENLTKLKEKYKGPVIPCSALAEYVLRKYHEDKIVEYIPGSDDFKIIDEERLKPHELDVLKKIKEEILVRFNGTGVQQSLNYAALTISDLISIYPVSDINNYSDKDGNVLPDVFLVKKGTILIDFVRDKIHSDFAKHFIYGIDARTKKRLGENYELKNNDIIKIVAAI